MPGLRSSNIVVSALALLLVSACGGGDDGAIASSEVSAGETSSSVGLTASTSADQPASTTADQPGDSDQTEDSDQLGDSDQPDTTDRPTTSEPATTTETTGSAQSTTDGAPVGQVLEPGDVGAFTSPSGNIACLMTAEFGASCWISEKDWDLADGPDCDGLDSGNAVDVTAAGIEWPCYGDFSWDPFAEALDYGDAMMVGQFRCDSAQAGVTCRNGSGHNFRLAKAKVTIEQS